MFVIEENRGTVGLMAHSIFYPESKTFCFSSLRVHQTIQPFPLWVFSQGVCWGHGYPSGTIKVGRAMTTKSRSLSLERAFRMFLNCIITFQLQSKHEGTNGTVGGKGLDHHHLVTMSVRTAHTSVFQRKTRWALSLSPFGSIWLRVFCGVEMRRWN